LDQSVDDRAQRNCCEHCTQPIETLLIVTSAALGNVQDRDYDNCHGNRHVEKKDCPPRKVFDQPTAKDRTKSAGYCSKTRPRPNSLTSPLFVKRSTDDR